MARSALYDVNYQTDNLIPLSFSLENGNISPGAEERYDFYNGSSTPLELLAGKTELTDYDCSYVTLLEEYENFSDSISPFEISLTAEVSESGLIDLSANLTVTEEFTSANIKMFFALTNWNADTDIDSWFYRVIDFAGGDALEISNISDSQLFIEEMEHELTDITNLHAVAFIQNLDSSYVMQAAQISLGQPSSVETVEIEPKSDLLRILSNPIENSVCNISYNVKSPTSNSDLKIYNSKGQFVMSILEQRKNSGIYQTSFSTKNLSSGVYFALFSNGKNIESKKLLIMK